MFNICLRLLAVRLCQVSAPEKARGFLELSDMCFCCFALLSQLPSFEIPPFAKELQQTGWPAHFPLEWGQTRLRDAFHFFRTDYMTEIGFYAGLCDEQLLSPAQEPKKVCPKRFVKVCIWYPVVVLTARGNYLGLL